MALTLMPDGRLPSPQGGVLNEMILAEDSKRKADKERKSKKLLLAAQKQAPEPASPPEEPAQKAPEEVQGRKGEVVPTRRLPWQS